MEKIHTYERNVFYYETDRMEVVHHSNYIRWFEEARIHFMKKVGFPYDLMESKGIMLPVLSANCNYKNSVRFGDTILIQACISFFNGFKMEVQYKVIDKKTGVLRATGSTTHCFTDMKMNPLRIKKSFPEIYKIFSEVSPENLF